MGPGQRVVQLQRLAVESDGLVGPVGFGVGDRHVLKHTEIGWVVPKSESIRCQRRIVVALTFQGERFVQIVEPLRFEITSTAAPEQAVPEGHYLRENMAAHRQWQRCWLRIVSGRPKGYNPTTMAAPTREDHRDIIQIDWAFFGEMCRALALRIAAGYDPELVVGIAKAGVIPGAVVATMLDRDFASMVVGRTGESDTPTLLSPAPPAVRGKRVLLVDETCDTGDTLSMALEAVNELEPVEVQTAVSFVTGDFQPDYHGMATRNLIVLPWDHEVVVDGELVPRYSPEDIKGVWGLGDSPL